MHGTELIVHAGEMVNGCVGGPRERDPPIFVLGLDLLLRCLHFASGSGRSWNFNTLGFVPLPPSMWKGVRLPKVAHSPLPLQPAFGLSMRSSKKPRGLPPSIHDFDQYRNAARAPSTFFLSMINPCAAFSGSVRPRLPLLRTMFLAQCRHRLAKRWSVHR